MDTNHSLLKCSEQSWASGPEKNINVVDMGTRVLLGYIKHATSASNSDLHRPFSIRDCNDAIVKWSC